MAKYNVIFVLGAPGSGKGTQCEKIVEKYGYVHLSAGDLLRAERQKGSELGEAIAKHIKDGTIVPVEVTCRLLKTAMEEATDKNNFLIDGFPRNKDNLDGWNNVMNTVADVKKVLFFVCSQEACVSRCLKRGQTSGRTDDNEDSLKKRFVTYTESTLPIIEIYRKSGLVAEINAEEGPDEVFTHVQKCLDSLQ